MRLETTITDTRAAQLDEVVKELKTTRSQVVEEALALFLKAFMEAKHGRRVAIIEPETRKTVTEVVSPSLAQLEWTANREKIVLSEAEMTKVADLVAKPAEPTAALRKVLAKRKR